MTETPLTPRTSAVQEAINEADKESVLLRDAVRQTALDKKETPLTDAELGNLIYEAGYKQPDIKFIVMGATARRLLTADALTQGWLTCRDQIADSFTGNLVAIGAGIRALKPPAEFPASPLMIEKMFGGKEEVPPSPLEEENKRLRETMQKIASCKSYFSDDVVAVARAALNPAPREGEGT